ncbi:hypothetical protein FB554_2381 [Barrientosiimonas humi]|uniref:Uncharacterized protein n=2 Tax=Barrientosiimonas TaxID=1535207 RepID=A0A542XEH6_9MICO|nr:hypothetical protein FB554_2381 [Barrientosiimonas humi]CAG7574210.1 hypothetical protein BH39T_PBIAJDOK_02853 [Barrientosiimonas humi]
MCPGSQHLPSVTGMTALSTAVRATHLLTNAAWFGGSLMGAVSLNAASHEAGSRQDTARVAGTGWERWGPVQGGAIALHLLSGLAIVADNRRRTTLHAPTRGAVVAKTALTGVALAATGAAWDQGRKLGDLREGKAGAAGQDEQQLHQRLAVLRWVVPAATGALLVLDAYLGEQQRGAAGLLDRVLR